MERHLPALSLALLLLLLGNDAYAYIDAGTGSFIIQMLVASILGALFTAKLWFGAAKRFIRRHITARSAGDQDSGRV